MTTIAFLLFILGALCFIFSDSRNALYIRQQYYIFSRKRLRMKANLSRQKSEQRLKELGIPFSIYYIELARYFFLVFVGGIWFGLSSTIRFHEVQYIPLVAVIMIFFLTKPKEKIAGFKTPFAYVLGALESVQRGRYGKELYQLMTQMKNSFQVYGDTAPSAVAIIEDLTAYTDKLQPIMRRFLAYWYSNDKDHAVEYFSNKIGTSEAKKVAQLFIRLDDLKPSELMLQLNEHIKIFREIRNTARVRRDQSVSYVLFLAAFGSVFLVLFDFITVAVLVDYLYNQNDLSF